PDDAASFGFHQPAGFSGLIGGLKRVGTPAMQVLFAADHAHLIPNARDDCVVIVQPAWANANIGFRGGGHRDQSCIRTSTMLGMLCMVSICSGVNWRPNATSSDRMMFRFWTDSQSRDSRVKPSLSCSTFTPSVSATICLTCCSIDWRS